MWFGLLQLASVILVCYSRDLDEGCFDLNEIPLKPVPPKVIRVTGTGFLYSPGFEKYQHYPSSVLCQYQLQAPEGKHVRLHFKFMDIDYTEGCGADALSIFDFTSSREGTITELLCGYFLPNDIVSVSHAMQLVLRTDEFAEAYGFNISYSPQTSSYVCPSSQKTCRNRKCVDYSQVCDGNDDCGDGTDEEKCSTTLPTTECGVAEVHQSDSLLSRIVGGQEAVEGRWPWMADLQMKLIQPNGHTCGGVLINAQWVLSAAHCFSDLPTPEDWRIHLGSHKKSEPDTGEQIRYPQRIVIYDDIPPSKFERDGLFDIVHDIALIKLNAPVKFSKYVKPVCLPDPLIKLTASTNCYAVGWGATRGTGSSDALKQAYHPIKDNVFCTRLVGSEFEPTTMICAGSLAPLNGVCHGDSGGPLLCEEDGKWTVAGVASFVTKGTGTEGLCGVKGAPSVFNKVSAKLAYIRRIINRYS